MRRNLGCPTIWYRIHAHVNVDHCCAWIYEFWVVWSTFDVMTRYKKRIYTISADTEHREGNQNVLHNWSCILIVSLSATCSLHSYIHLLKKQMNNLTKFQESSHLHRKTHFLFVFRFSIKDSIIPLACSVNVHCIAARCTYSYQTTCFVERRIMKFNHC